MARKPRLLIGIAVIGCAILTTPVSGQGLPKKGQIVTLKIPISVMKCIGPAGRDLLCSVTITSLDGSSSGVKVGDRSDWETCCVPSLIEFEVDGIQLPKKDNPNTIVSLGEVTTSLVSLAFGPSIQNVEAALAQVVIQGPATGPAVIEYKAQSYARSSPKLFVGSLAAVGEDKKVQVLRFLAEFGRTGGPPEKIADSYKEKSYFVLDLGSGSTVYNTIQMDESARVARTVNDRVLKVLKASLAPLADLGEIAVSGVRVDMKILSRNFANRGAEPSIDALQIYAPRELVRKFADADITSQQLIDGCVVLVNDNRVQVLLGAGAR